MTSAGSVRSLELCFPPAQARAQHISPSVHARSRGYESAGRVYAGTCTRKVKGKPHFFAIKGKEQNSSAEFTCLAAPGRGKRMLLPPTDLLPSPGLPPSEACPCKSHSWQEPAISCKDIRTSQEERESQELGLLPSVPA